ncbi:MAG: hypothetical protein WD875_11835 [Pirellulales bacterium]
MGSRPQRKWSSAVYSRRDCLGYPLRIDGVRDRRLLDEVCEHSLRGAALWEEAKDRLHESALKHVVRPGAGPGGVTIKAPDNETIGAYMAARDGFRTVVKDDRIWVFRGGTKELAEFLAKGEPAYHVTRPSAGPMGMTIKAPDAETLDAYLRGDG